MVAQSPLLVDQVQIEPGSTGTRKISMDSTDNSMQFEDPVVSAALTLLKLAGLRNVTGMFIVGRAGDGAPYTSIQDALDAVPDASGSSAPSLVWVLPGEYTENVDLQKDGVILASPGGARLLNSGSSDTLTVSASLAATPQYTRIIGLEIENDEAAYACIKIEGADSFASATATVDSAPLTVADTIVINAVTLTGTASARTSGSNDFNVSGSTVTAVAAEIAAAINDTANSFASFVEASSVLGVVTIEATEAGAAGNAYTLTTTSADVTPSGATFSGGGAAGSLVASEGLLIRDCLLVATGAGGYQVYADTANDITVQGGSWRGSALTSESWAINCASFRVMGVEWGNDFQFSYDDTADEPNNTRSEYALLSCGRVGNFTVNLDGDQDLSMGSCPSVGNITLGGDRSFAATHCSLGVLTLSGTVTVTLGQCSRGTASDAGGTATMDETRILGSQAFAASATEAVAFDVDQSDALYTVALESPTTAEVLGVSAKATTGFTIDASGVITGTVRYIVSRDV
jgi:hypothetical protein